MVCGVCCVFHGARRILLAAPGNRGECWRPGHGSASRAAPHGAQWMVFVLWVSMVPLCVSDCCNVWAHPTPRWCCIVWANPTPGGVASLHRVGSPHPQVVYKRDVALLGLCAELDIPGSRHGDGIRHWVPSVMGLNTEYPATPSADGSAPPIRTDTYNRRWCVCIHANRAPDSHHICRATHSAACKAPRHRAALLS
jgi:hypothetical protein